MKLAIVLPGGGACGRSQAAKLQYLSDIGVLAQADLICGTSVGGLNALLVGKYADDFNPATEMWHGIKSNKDVFDGMLQVGNFWDAVGMLGQTFKSNAGKSILKPTGLYKILDREFGKMTLKDLKKTVIITSTNMSSGERVLFDSRTNTDISAAMVAKATSAIPLAFPGVDYNKDVLVDGGLGRNNPVAVAIENGATHIILIGCYPDEYPRKEIKNNVIDVALRMTDVIMHTFEAEAWEEKEEYEEKRKLDPTLPEIKFLDSYPVKAGNSLDFGNVEDWSIGYEQAIVYFSPIRIDAFLK